MNKKGLIGLAVACTLFVTGCGNSTKPVKDRFELTAEEWNKDIDYLKKSVEKNHYDPFHSLSKEEWNKEVEKLKEDVPKLSAVEVSLRLNQLVARLQDENTVIDYSTLVGQSREEMIVYPFTLDWIENKLVVLQGNDEAKEAVGKQLVRINDVPIEDVIQKVNTLIPYENESWTKINSRVLVTFPEVLKFFGITKEDEVNFTFSSKEGKEENLRLKPMKYEEIKFTKDLSEEFRKGVTQTVPKDGYSTYWYKYVPTEEVFYFQYNQGVFKDDIKGNNSVELPKFKTFKQELVTAINKQDIKTFIVDLRREMSGNSARMKEIIEALKKETKLFEQAKIYVLIGTNTFGTGIQDALKWKEQGNVTLVGEQTGGQAIQSLKASGYRLPNSQIVLQVPTDLEVDQKQQGPIQPDIEVTQSLDDYVKGIDTMYQSVLAK